MPHLRPFKSFFGEDGSFYTAEAMVDIGTESVLYTGTIWHQLFGRDPIVATYASGPMISLEAIPMDPLDPFYPTREFGAVADDPDLYKHSPKYYDITSLNMPYRADGTEAGIINWGAESISEHLNWHKSVLAQKIGTLYIAMENPEEIKREILKIKDEEYFPSKSDSETAKKHGLTYVDSEGKIQGDAEAYLEYKADLTVKRIEDRADVIASVVINAIEGYLGSVYPRYLRSQVINMLNQRQASPTSYGYRYGTSEDTGEYMTLFETLMYESQARSTFAFSAWLGGPGALEGGGGEDGGTDSAAWLAWLEGGDPTTS